MQKFIVVCRARSGSEALMNCVKQHPDINVYGEIFNYYRKTNLFCKKEGLPYLDYEENSLLFSKNNCIEAHKKYDGFKLLLCHLNEDVADYLKEVYVFSLYRENLLEMHVSYLVALQTKVWAKNNKEFTGTVTVNIDLLEKDILSTKKQYSDIEQHVDRKLYYKDGVIKNSQIIFESLNLKEFTPNVEDKKRILRPISDVIENYNEVKHFDHSDYFYR